MVVRRLPCFVALLACLTGAVAAVPIADAILRLPPPAFPAVTALWQQGKPADALALLESRRDNQSVGETTLPRAVLRARLLFETGRFADAAAAWEEIAPADQALAQFAHRNAFEAELGAGRPANARALLGVLSTRGDEDSELLLMLAAAYRARRDLEEARLLYDRVLAREQASVHRDAALLGLASLFEQQGNLDGALRTLRRAEIEHHDSATYVRARAAEQRLVRNGARPVPLLPCGQALDLAARLRRAARYREALELLEPCRAAGTEAADREAADVEAITNLYLVRDNDAARKSAARFVAEFPASRLSGGVRQTAFRLAVREGETDVARKLGTRLWREGAPGLTASERWGAARLLAAHLASIGSLEDAIAIYVELARPPTSRANRIDTLWRGGLAAMRAGQPGRARSMLRQADGLRPGPDTAPLVRYWLGVAELAGGDGAEGRRLLEALADSSPFSYYGMRASVRLGRPSARTTAAARASAFPAPEMSGTAERHPFFRAASLLSTAGLAPEAAAFARQLLRALPSDRALVLLAARAAASAGDYRDAYRLSVNSFNWLLQQPIPGTPDDLWSLAYPRAYWSAVEPAASASRVDPLFLLALMRQESGFDPRARSNAGALGLFQVMPDKARELAPRVGIPVVDEDDLVDPRINARLAASLVADLVKQFGGAVAPVAAAFNAGEDLVGRWWDAAKGQPEDVFVDSIPYAETRRYVREVLASYATYQRLYGPR